MNGRRFVAAITLAWACSLPGPAAQAEARRALLVGINHYDRPGGPASRGAGAPDRGFTDLEGARNDVEGMRALLVGRFGFAPRDIVVLSDSEATRQAILARFRTHLLAPSQRGDVCVFYFAGHGSYVTNSKSPEADKLDETIVPADAPLAGDATRDIRDKEIARLFNDLLDRGAIVTAFFDCCHSGSIARGLGGPGRLRSLRPDLRDVADAGADPRGAPADRGALVFSAAQSSQKAAEVLDGEGVPHGAFSLMLAKTLRSVPRGEPAGRIAARVRALVVNAETGQTPVVAATAGRLASPLFGGAPEREGSDLVLAVEKIDGDHCRLPAGTALGLYPGCELVPVHAGPPAGAGAPRVRLRVEKVEGPAHSTAVCIAGNLADTQPGDEFAVDRWVAPPSARLRFFVPPALDAAGVQRAALEFGALAHRTDLRWVDDPTVLSPTHVVAWDGRGWFIRGPGGRQDEVTPTAAGVLQVLARERSGKTAPALFVQIPPRVTDVQRLTSGIERSAATVEFVAAESDAQYLLAGRAAPGVAEYAWVARNATQAELAGHTSLPACTNWFRGGADSLRDCAFRLARIRGWLELDAPPGVRRFPYRLTARTGTRVVEEGGTVRGGDQVSLALDAAPQDLELGSNRFYVYVFAIDSYGKSTLLFPRDDTGVPLPDPRTYVGGLPPAHIALVDSIEVIKPYGTDTYVLLTTKDALEDPRRDLQFDGVREPTRTRGGAAAPTDPLAALLGSLNSPVRGARPATPATWSIERLPLLSVPKR